MEKQYQGWQGMRLSQVYNACSLFSGDVAQPQQRKDEKFGTPVRSAVPPGARALLLVNAILYRLRVGGTFDFLVDIIAMSVLDARTRSQQRSACGTTYIAG